LPPGDFENHSKLSVTMREGFSPAPASPSVVPHLRRLLSVWDLVLYGIILVQPIAPIPLFGVAQQLSDGHFVTTLLIAMFAMMITAFSYGRMAALYPSAGSAYTFVSRGLNVYLGFLVGWAMILVYLLVPLVNAIWVAVALHSRYFPRLPYPIAMFLVVAFMTGLNLRGIKSSARANKVLLISMSVVTVAFIFLAVRYLLQNQGWNGLFRRYPFTIPKLSNLALCGTPHRTRHLPTSDSRVSARSPRTSRIPSATCCSPPCWSVCSPGYLQACWYIWASAYGPTGAPSPISKRLSWTFASAWEGRGSFKAWGSPSSWLRWEAH